MLERKKRVDDDWKRRAEEEKRKIEDSLRPPEPAAAEGPARTGPGGAGVAGGPAAAGGGATSGLPPEPKGISGTPRVDFISLLQMLATQAAAGLGQFPDPRTGLRSLDLELARDGIDMLSVLEAKTRGNLNAEEDSVLRELLTSLRFAFAQAARAAAAPPPPPPPGQR